MIDFSENKKGNFHKAGHCFIKTFVFLFLGIAEWQYDSLKQKVDSMYEINSRTAEYSRIIQQR